MLKPSTLSGRGADLSWKRPCGKLQQLDVGAQLHVGLVQANAL